jgi:hypothetical protein
VSEEAQLPNKLSSLQAGGDFDWSPYLQPGEEVLIWGTEKFSFAQFRNLALPLLFLGGGIATAYFGYYRYPDVQAACPPGSMRDCAKFYGNAPFIVWAGGLFGAFALLSWFGLAIGLFRIYWSITTKRAIRVAVGMLRWKMAAELPGATIKTSFLGTIQIRNVGILPRDAAERRAIEDFAQQGGAR